MVADGNEGGRMGRRRLPPGVSNPIDIHVGNRLRFHRTSLDYSQESLGDEVGLTFQQIQKYERGANRIGASRLYQFARILDAPVAYFFEELPDEIRSHEGQLDWGMASRRQEELAHSPMARRETLELVRAYYRIEVPAVRQRLFDLIKILAKTAD